MRIRCECRRLCKGAALFGAILFVASMLSLVPIGLSRSPVPQSASGGGGPCPGPGLGVAASGNVFILLLTASALGGALVATVSLAILRRLRAVRRHAH